MPSSRTKRGPQKANAAAKAALSRLPKIPQNCLIRL